MDQLVFAHSKNNARIHQILEPHSIRAKPVFSSICIEESPVLYRFKDNTRIQVRKI